MRRVLVLLLASALVPAAVGAASVRTVTAAAPVTALAMDARRIAYAEGRSAHDCDRIRIWNLSTRGVSKLGRSTSCVQTSTGTGIAAVALAGTRVLWLHYTGGNIREWRLFTATASTTKPRLLRTVSRDVDAPAPIVVGDADTSRLGDLLPYAVDRDVIVLRANGARRFSWRAPARVVALSAGEGELAVASDGGLVTVLDGAGRQIRSEQFAGELSAVQITGSGLLAQRGRALELRGEGAAKTFTLPAGSRLEDALGSRALFVTGGQTRQLLLTTGAQRTIAPGTHVDAELSTVAVSTGRRVSARPLP